MPRRKSNESVNRLGFGTGTDVRTGNDAQSLEKPTGEQVMRIFMVLVLMVVSTDSEKETDLVTHGDNRPNIVGNKGTVVVDDIDDEELGPHDVNVIVDRGNWWKTRPDRRSVTIVCGNEYKASTRTMTADSRDICKLMDCINQSSTNRCQEVIDKIHEVDDTKLCLHIGKERSCATVTKSK